MFIQRRAHGLTTSWIIALMVGAWPSAATAEAPWALPLSAEQEQSFLARALEQEPDASSLRAELAKAAASGTLISIGTCATSGNVRGQIHLDWEANVESVATIELANLSDTTIWLIELDVGSKDDAWLANLPFLPPHSSTTLTTPCNNLTLIDGGRDSLSFDTMKISSMPGPMNVALAWVLAETPAHFRHSQHFGKIVGSNLPGERSLAAISLPLVDDRDTARLLAEALLEAEDSAASLPSLLGAATLEGAHGILDALLAARLAEDPEALAELLEATLPHRNELNDEALGRLVGRVCAGVDRERRRALTLATLAATARLWKPVFLDACALDRADTLFVIDVLLDGSDGRLGRNRLALSEFIELAPEPVFELALPTILGAREPGTEPPEPDPDLEPTLEPPVGEELRDGGQRPPALWIALAAPPQDPARGLALEELIRPADVAAVLATFIAMNMTDERLVLFDRIAARIEELPPPARAPALLPVMQAGVAAPFLEPALARRMFALSELDRDILRPTMLEAMAKNQSVFTAEAVATLDHGYDEIVELFVSELAGCAHSLVALAACFDTFDADPRLRAAARGSGLTEAFLLSSARVLARPDPSEEQRALLQRAMEFGVDTEPATLAVCERFTELQAFALDTEAHLAFLREVSPDHPCARAIEDAFINQRRILYGLAGGVTVVVLAGALLFVVRRRRQAAVLAEL